MYFLGEVRSACRLRVRIAYNHAGTDAGGPTWVDDKYFTVTPTTAGAPLRFRHGPRFHKATAIKIRLTAYALHTDTPPTGEALRLTGVTLSLAPKNGIWPGLPAAQKQ
jgi:hypothetical protein